jgi:iron complex transport system substrate-binding protein
MVNLRTNLSWSPRGGAACAARLAVAMLAGVLAVGRVPAAGASPEAEAGVAAGGRLRIVSLGPAITEQVCQLGAANQLEGVTTYCRLPEGGEARITRIGTVTGISAEQILGLRPDLVLATGLTHPRDVERLTALGIRVERLGYARDFESICGQMLRLGELLGAERKAGELVELARQRLAALAVTLAGRARTTVFVEIGARPLFTADRETFIHDMMVRAGGENVAADAKGGFFSREQVLARDPEVIVVVTMETAAEEERAGWMAVGALRAAAAGRVHVMDAYAVCSPTPTAFVESVEAMAALFHPGLVVGP